MSKDMLVRFIGDEAAVAQLEDRRLDEIALPRRDNANLLGNIYLGEVENVLPGMQAAFVNIGLEKNSFLYVEDAISADTHRLPEDRQNAGDKDRSISDLVKKGQQIIVQIFKEPSGTKGARVTMQPSLPGRYLVLLPCGNYIAVSRRIEDEGERERLKELVRADLPPNMGAIIRTVAEHADQQVLTGELRSLLKTWRRIQGWSVKSKAPSLLHSDMDLLERTIRDTNPADVDRIVVADEQAFEKVSDVIGAIAPALQSKIVLEETADLFLDYDVYSQIERALQRKVWLKSGGYIIIDQMEALTAIDVNTGKYVGERSLNDTVFKTNMEAVNEIARQLRLRNIGGIVIVDFIDMDNAEDKNRLLAALEEEMKKDRVRITVMGITQLGLVELTRKKIGHDLSSVLECECRACGGKGRISQVSQVFRLEKKA
ncbi:MAG: Rne/Rng family ribonuclease [Firmicutes bacterium]|nr:Rne/Rng family ribonuclease [Bacillota bacterium]